jgi:TP901 family phage tail tape measure protein
MIGGGAQKITVEIGGKIAASLGASLRKAQTQVSSFGRNVSRTMNDAATAGKKGFKNIFSNDLWQGAAAGAASIGAGMMLSVRAAAKFEQSLTEISKTAQLTGTQTKALGADILRMTTETNQSGEELNRGFKALVGSGLEFELANKALRGTGRVATATQSDIEDVALTTYQLIKNLKVLPEQTEKAFDILAYSGKQGAFELKDMAREFPKVASSAQKLGIVGLKGTASLGAMLQVVRRGASDSGTAANNLVNLLEKITGQDAVKNFKMFGVDIEKVVKDAQKNGLNPLEESIKVIQKLTKGDPFALNKLFGDMQVKAALAPLLKDFKQYEDIRDRALKANGIIDEDYLKQLNTFVGRMKSFTVATDRLGITLGNALLPSLTRIAKALTPMIEGFAKFASDHPRITTGIVTIAGALAGLILIAPGLKAVAGGFAFIWNTVAGMKIGATIAGWLPAIVKFARVASIASLSFGKAMGVAMLGATKAVISFGISAFAAMLPLLPWIALIAGIGVAIYLLVKNWGEVKKAAANAWAGIQAAWGRFTTWIGGVFNKALGVIKAWAPKVLGFLFPVPGMIIRLFTSSGIGQRIITSIIKGLKAKFGALVGWVRGAWSNISSVFGGGGGAAPAAAPQPPGRAIGGAVRAGFPYVVGERRRELFVPGMDGAIIPRVARPVAAGGGVTINAPVTINAAGGNAMEIRNQVRAAFEDLMAMASSGYRVALND